MWHYESMGIYCCGETDYIFIDIDIYTVLHISVYTYVYIYIGICDDDLL